MSRRAGGFSSLSRGDATSAPTLKNSVKDALKEVNEDAVVIAEAIRQGNNRAYRAWAAWNSFSLLRNGNKDAATQADYEAFEDFHSLTGLDSWALDDPALEMALFLDYATVYQPLHNHVRAMLRENIEAQIIYERICDLGIDITCRELFLDFDTHGQLLLALSELVTNAIQAGAMKISVSGGAFGYTLDGPFVFPEEQVAVPFRIGVDCNEMVLECSDQGAKGIFFIISDDIEYPPIVADAIVSNLNSSEPRSSRNGGVGFMLPRNCLRELGGELEAVAYLESDNSAKVCVLGYVNVQKLTSCMNSLG